MKGFRTTLVVLLLALSLSGCSANRIAPPPWVAGAECEVSDDPAENAAMAMWLGSLAVTGLALASMPRDDESALIYLTVGVIPPLVMVPSAFTVRSNGRSNAYACRAYLRGLKDRIVLEREMLRQSRRRTRSKVSDSDAQSEGLQKPSLPEREPTPIVPIRGDDPK